MQVLFSTSAELEKTHIIKVYDMQDNNKAESARILGIGINTLRRKLKAYGVKRLRIRKNPSLQEKHDLGQGHVNGFQFTRFFCKSLVECHEFIGLTT